MIESVSLRCLAAFPGKVFSLPAPRPGPEVLEKSFVLRVFLGSEVPACQRYMVPLGEPFSLESPSPHAAEPDGHAKH